MCIERLGRQSESIHAHFRKVIEVYFHSIPSSHYWYYSGTADDLASQTSDTEHDGDTDTATATDSESDSDEPEPLENKALWNLEEVMFEHSDTQALTCTPRRMQACTRSHSSSSWSAWSPEQPP